MSLTEIDRSGPRPAPSPEGSILLMRLGAAAAVLSAVSTFMLWWLPRQVPPTASFEDALQLATNPYYLARLWINLGHVFVALAAYGTVAALVARRQPGLAWIGFVAMAFWAFSEALGVSINIWAQNAEWRMAYGAADQQTKESIRTAILTYQGFWNGIFFVVLLAFAIGSLGLGLGVHRSDWLSSAVSVLLLAAVPLTFVIMLDGYFGFNLSRWIEWTYPILQPVSRTLMGVWIWRAASALGRAERS